MRRTHLSLYYLFSYLTFGGVGMFAAPKLALKLLASTGEYGDVLPRMVGMLMIGLAIIVAAIIRFRVEVMVPVTLVVRLFFLVAMTWLYFYAGDPFFLALDGIVGLGVALTGTTWLLERRAAKPA